MCIDTPILNIVQHNLHLIWLLSAEKKQAIDKIPNFLVTKKSYEHCHFNVVCKRNGERRHVVRGFMSEQAGMRFMNISRRQLNTHLDVDFMLEFVGRRVQEAEQGTDGHVLNDHFGGSDGNRPGRLVWIATGSGIARGGGDIGGSSSGVALGTGCGIRETCLAHAQRSRYGYLACRDNSLLRWPGDCGGSGSGEESTYWSPCR